MKDAQTTPESAASGAAECLGAVDRLLVSALKALDEAGQNDLACRIAAEAWSATHRLFPDEAQRFNGALHYLCRTRHPREKKTGVPGA
jgi:hypothetical protein